MMSDLGGCGASECISGSHAWIGAVLSIAGALLLAVFLSLADGPVAETIALVMLPGVLGIGHQWMLLRGRSRPVQAVLILGPLVLLFLIGLVAGLAVSD